METLRMDTVRGGKEDGMGRRRRRGNANKTYRYDVDREPGKSVDKPYQYDVDYGDDDLGSETMPGYQAPDYSGAAHPPQNFQQYFQSIAQGKLKPNYKKHPKTGKPLGRVENPFPDKQELRLGAYKIIEERDDYCLCEGYDPNASIDFNDGRTPSAARKNIRVMKPPELQKGVWDGETFTVNGIEKTYTAGATGVRTATWTDGDGNEHEEEEHIFMPYREGDFLVAVELRKNSVQDGTDVKDEKGARMSWADLNVSGRNWKGPATAECTPQNAIMQITIFGSPGSGTFDWNLDVGDGAGIVTYVFQFDQTAESIESQIPDVEVTGGPFPNATIQIEFIGDNGNRPIAIPTANFSQLADGDGLGVVTSLVQLGVS